MELSPFLEINIWTVLIALGCYQLYLQIKKEKGTGFPEGLIKRLQYLVGIPTLGNLIIFLLDPDALGFGFIYLPHLLVAFGLLLFNISTLIIVWAHFTLGKFWSGDLITRSDHKLIDTGPYHFIRHPLYTSYLFLTIGLFLATGSWLVGATMLLYFIVVAGRAWKEEEMLLERLGEIYKVYMGRTGRFVPKKASYKEKSRRI